MRGWDPQPGPRHTSEGTYAEHVKVTSGVALVGGFACGTWTYSGAKVTVSPSDAGYGLEVADAKADVSVWDVAFVAANATAKGESSIAAFVHGASKVLLVRSTLEAGTGKEGEDGAAGTTGAPTSGVTEFRTLGRGLRAHAQSCRRR